MNLTLSEKISYSTIRIECSFQDGSKGTGTGFFFNFLEDKETDQYAPVIITNKHVVENSIKGKITFTKANDKGEPLDTEHLPMEIDNFKDEWIFHDDENVDLCALPLASILLKLEALNQKIFYLPITKELIPSKDVIEDTTAIEEILMIGYPNGIWDSYNNKPIFRRGITATHPKLDYCGKKEIMIDAACFPGSSGSPVFILNEGIFKTKTTRLSSGDRIIFLGVLYAGPQHNAQGEIEIINVPTIQKPITISKIPNNLGLIIKSERILELEEKFKTL
ncbi:serine protease [Flavobacterium tructae]|uniref:S1 family peptidase n=1 Tax=Flavobacterium tructae TaxID=1114873 RepID=UPI00255207B2|nr:serine protease [Flavobacterium tructae]MDL2141960.1 serine protease [Flavobacterium tructae]